MGWVRDQDPPAQPCRHPKSNVDGQCPPAKVIQGLAVLLEMLLFRSGHDEVRDEVFRTEKANAVAAHFQQTLDLRGPIRCCPEVEISTPSAVTAARGRGRGLRRSEQHDDWPSLAVGPSSSSRGRTTSRPASPSTTTVECSLTCRVDPRQPAITGMPRALAMIDTWLVRPRLHHKQLDEGGIKPGCLGRRESGRDQDDGASMLWIRSSPSAPSFRSSLRSKSRRSSAFSRKIGSLSAWKRRDRSKIDSAVAWAASSRLSRMRFRIASRSAGSRSKPR